MSRKTTVARALLPASRCGSIGGTFFAFRTLAFRYTFAAVEQEIPFTARVEASDQVLFRELEGEAVILNLNDDSYYGLDEVGTRLWQLLISSESLDAACEAMLEEYDVPEDTLRKDVEEFVRQLLERQMIELRDGE
jgi:hypothetical protein